jgi:hypothetical protein
VESQKARGYKPKYKVLVGLLSFVSGVYGALFYAAEAMSERDYSGIPDPQLRVGYCMVSSTSSPDKYMFAETAARPPDFAMFSAVMPYALRGVITEEKRAAILALRERDELRLRAVRWSLRAADACGYGNVAWPPGTAPLDISMKWLAHDSTYLFFLERVKTDPDAAARVYDALRQSDDKARAAKS